MMTLLILEFSPFKNVNFICTSLNSTDNKVYKVIISKDSDLYNDSNERSEYCPEYWDTQFDQIIMVCLYTPPPSCTMQDFKFLQNSLKVIGDRKCCQKEV